MKKICFCTLGDTPALRYARNFLTGWGYPARQELGPEVTHVLLPVPTGEVPALPDHVTVFGGNLPGASIDLLQDPYYLAENAAITAHCAVEILLRALPKTLDRSAVLILGWGRIGQCLAQLLRAIGAEVTVAARKARDRAMIAALGYRSTTLPLPDRVEFDAVINTVPAPVMDAAAAQEHTVLLDLASVRGICGDGVLWERGLPGRLAPESAGLLMAKTVLRYSFGKE